MKLLPLLIISCVVTTAAQTELLIPSIEHSSLARHISTTSDESCQQDMTELGLDFDLSSSLEETLDTFSSHFIDNPLKYCKRRLGSAGTQLECVVDYESFSFNYKSMCRNLEAEYFPISLFMRCSGNELKIEMEMLNIPSCLAHECNRDEVTKALDLLLKSSENISDGYSCSYFHQSGTAIDQQTVLSINTGAKFDGLDSVSPSPRSRVHSTWWVLLGVSTVVIAILVGLKYNRKKHISFQQHEHQSYFGECNLHVGNVLIDSEKGDKGEEFVEIHVI